MQEQQGAEVYSIGRMSKICHVPIKTLRHYDVIGLLPADKKNPETNYRYYTYNQIIQLFFIQNMKMMGFSLKEIQDLMDRKDNAFLLGIIGQKIEELQEQIRRLEIQKGLAASFAERVRQNSEILDGSIPEDGENISLLAVEEIPATDVIFLHQYNTNYDNHIINVEARRDLLSLAKKHNMMLAGPFTATYHNPPLEQFFSNVCDYEISAPVVGELDPACCKKTGNYQALTCIYAGSYQNIINAHIQMLRWTKKHHCRVCGDISETFLITPIDTGNIESYVTKIIMPIASE
ncbi:MAG: MerR family transcriptional regulator [Oscillibacter sp.]|nr:MerR family transcriptional regulator [Oscillibacter sp.]